MTDAIFAEGLSKRYGKRTVVEAVDLRVPTGSFWAFLGPNGAGKSTVIRMLTGLAVPSAGRATVAGADIASDPMAVKARIGIVSEDIAVYERLSAAEFLEWIGRMRGLTGKESARRAGELLTRLDLAGDADRFIGDYSLGMKKKTALAAALLHGPSVLFLDEPFNGVDALSVRTLCTVLEDLTRNRGVTIFFTSHVFETIERLCDHASVIVAGQIVATGTIAEIKAQASTQNRGTLETAFAELVGAPDPATARPAQLDWF